MKMRRAQSIGTVETVAMVQSCDCTQLKLGSNESSPGRRSVSAYMLVECLVYISAVCFLLGAGYVALDRCITSSELLRRSADDITSAIHAGERWRADVRLATAEIRLVNTNGEQMLHLTGPRGTREYRFADGSIFRRVDEGAWSRMIANVQSSTMESDARGSVSAWRWELELQPRLKGPAKPGRVRPLFTFTAVAGRKSEQ